ncbi:MAG TPA: DNA-3-methyladenine glycosylase 2 family protein [Chitinophagaceae bacterium]|nr:DNA-3-methyladenine glycosylase 2 family protein [Chitinophagaceae bacterium]
MEHIKHLSKDKKFKKILEQQAFFVLAPRNKVYLQLCSSIISQQLSTKVAKVIFQRFLDLYHKKEPSAKEILATPVEKFRSIGFSNAKASYVHNVCNFFVENKLTDARLQKMSNEEVIDLLTQIKGVGKWTVEMILMFTLGREDVFAVDDLGIQQAITKMYKLDASDKKLMKEKMLQISAKWSPYRTYACRYLWGWKDTPK